MNIQTDTQEKHLKYRANFTNPLASRLDADQRSLAAISRSPEFFGSAEHQHRIARVIQICSGFFRIKGDTFVNHRDNRGRPFSTVKLSYCEFPNTMSSADKQRLYYQPLAELGIGVPGNKIRVTDQGRTHRIY